VPDDRAGQHLRAADGPGGAPAGIPGSQLSGPWPVGLYAARLRDRLRDFAHVQLFGEVFNLRPGRARVWFELRDGAGALPCSMWREDFDALAVPPSDGRQVVAAGGCEFYPGSRTASPAFSFAVSDARPAGDGDLLAQLDRLRRQLLAEGLCEPQKRLPRPALPRCIGVVTGEGGKARDDVLAGLRRRGWAGRVVWAFAPVQDRRAAPAVTRALQDLAARDEVEVVIVARGGGSFADLFAFCDETLCRTVALLRVPVIASVGHHADRTLIDEVAAVSCSTPTHAAEAAVPLHCGEARAALHGVAGRLARQGRRAALERGPFHALAARLQRHARQAIAERATLHGFAGRLERHAGRAIAERAPLHAFATRLERQGRRAIVERARLLARLSRAPSDHIGRQRTRLHQQLREVRAGTHRGLVDRRRGLAAQATALDRRAGAALLSSRRGAGRAQAGAAALAHAATVAGAGRAADLEHLRLALDAHDPQRTLERGYVLVEDAAGAPVTSAATARRRSRLTLRLSDGSVAVRPERERRAS
jgi:exodeoxyribonuclease VII large subunit